MSRARTLQRIQYKAGTTIWEGLKHPELPWLEVKQGSVIDKVDLLASGIVERGAEQLEYIDVRVWVAK